MKITGRKKSARISVAMTPGAGMMGEEGAILVVLPPSSALPNQKPLNRHADGAVKTAHRCDDHAAAALSDKQQTL